MRRIAAILAMDMVGYSRLMEADEAGTLARQKRHLAELIDPKIASHGGQIIKRTGDGLIAEFPSVVEAVQCAATIQIEMAVREADEPTDRTISYRAAINLGDVIFEDGDIFGDGVNIAARLEALADPGGVIVSGTAYDHLKANVKVGYEDLGDQKVKNITRPVRAWRLLLDPEKAGHVVRKPRLGPGKPAMLASALVVLLVGGVWWSDSMGLRDPPAGQDSMREPVAASIVVLPFSNLSDDAGQYFVDGMTDDLIVRLAKIDDLVVIARNTAFTYKGKNVKVQEIGRDLNVRYVLEGSVRRSGGRVRINAQLVDAETESNVWAEMFDREADEVFALQDEVTTQIAGALQLRLAPDNDSGDPEDRGVSLQAYDLYLRGMSELRQRKPVAFERARVYLSEALDIDPSYAEAHAALAFLYWESNQHGWLRDVGVAGVSAAYDLVEHHLEMASDTPTPIAHLVRSEWLSDMEKDSGGAIAEARKAIELDPSFAEGYIVLAARLALDNQTEEALKIADEALRLDPVTPPDYHLTVGLAHIIAANYDAAIDALEASVRDGNPKNAPWILLAAAYGHEQRYQDAAAALTAINTNNQASGRGQFTANSIFNWAIPDLSIRERLFEDLKSAGAPYSDSPLSEGLAVRQLSGQEIRNLWFPGAAEGIVIDPAGERTGFTWITDADGNMEFSAWNRVFKTSYTFTEDQTCSHRGCARVYELAEAEADKWGHPYMTVGETGMIYYFTIKDAPEEQR